MILTHARVRAFAKAAAIAGWITLALRFYLSISTSLADGNSVGAGIVTFFSYFTVLTNILVTLALTAGGWISRQSHAQTSILRFFSKPHVATAIAVYVTVVAVIYHILLSHLWDPQGLSKALDVMQHSVMPGFYLLYWWWGIPKRSLQWRGAITWLCYPISYSIYTLLLGAIRNKYPYPFADVNALGYGQVIKNSISIYFFFTLLSLAFIGLGRLPQPRSIQS